MIEQPALQLGLWQVLDIVAVALILYQLYRLTRGTAAIRIFLGILAIYLVYQIVDALQMRMLAEILGQFIGVGVIALLIVFQQELRQFLLLIGNRQFVRSAPPWIQKWFGRNGNGQGAPSQWTELRLGLEECRRRRLGALVVIPREADPGPVATGWVPIDAQVSAGLIVSLFEKASPLHDGAAWSVKRRAPCRLPKKAGCSSGFVSRCWKAGWKPPSHPATPLHTEDWNQRTRNASEAPQSVLRTYVPAGHPSVRKMDQHSACIGQSA